MLLDVRNLDKSFGGVAAVSGATFGVAEGSITALIGPNGAGKTTVFNLVSGFIRPDSGTVRFDGRDIAGARGDAVARAGLVRAFQAPRVLTRMSVLPAVHAHTGELLQIPKLSAVRVPDEPHWFVPVNTAYLL